MKKPADCKNILEIRSEIDRIDHELMKLLSERQEYVEAVVKFKTNTESVIAADRQKMMIGARREWAQKLNLSPEYIEEFFRQLIQHNIERELKLMEK